ncbi:hypothetical protein [Bradyrhizobium tropiciagri]|uniref:hypothetical protein n=1 Tax=Bradyrhizobium tropiciagri TaxID=312253 RepID=UPI001FCCF6EC|nr:hypothetical protein [Bradyrhizobium tropiciagri]
MIVTLERNGLVRRQADTPRSIEILVPPENFPILSWLRIKPSKLLSGANRARRPQANLKAR